MGTILDERDDRDANGSSVDTLYVRYDGEALRTHEMDVKQLAPALLSLAKAFDTLQTVSYTHLTLPTNSRG